MRFSRLPVFFLIVVFSCIISFAQTEAEKIKEKQARQNALLEQILADAKNLRLPENRAYVFAKIGCAVWNTDEKRARTLFQNAVSDLIVAQAEAENEKGTKQNLGNLIYGQTPRWEILYLIANIDADFALNSVTKTRPVKIARAIANFNGDYQSQSQQFARNELQNEQRLIALVAEQSPARAVQLLRENLKKNISYETLNLLKKIQQKDPETANQLAEEVGKRLLEMPLNEDNQDSSVMQSFLAEFGRENQPENAPLKISDPTLRNLAEKIVKFILRPASTSFYIDQAALKVIDSFAPADTARIKQKQAKFENNYQNELQRNYSKLLQNNDVSSAELIRQADKFPRGYRNEIYRRAAEKTAQDGNAEQAREIFASNFSDEETDRYLSQINYNLAQQAVMQGKLDEANAFISRISENNLRINALTYLATTIYQKNPKENQQRAAAILDEARALVSESPETLGEINLLVGIAAAEAQIDSTRAFQIIEPLISPLNEYLEAEGVIAKFGVRGNFRQGENWIYSGNNASGVYNLPNILQNLKNKDFERTIQFVNGFSRLDTRISLELLLMEYNQSIKGTRRIVNFSSPTARSQVEEF